jgi:hypothetical protein
VLAPIADLHRLLALPASASRADVEAALDHETYMLRHHRPVLAKLTNRPTIVARAGSDPEQSLAQAAIASPRQTLLP